METWTNALLTIHFWVEWTCLLRKGIQGYESFAVQMQLYCNTGYSLITQNRWLQGRMWIEAMSGSTFSQDCYLKTGFLLEEKTVQLKHFDVRPRLSRHSVLQINCHLSPTDRQWAVWLPDQVGEEKVTSNAQPRQQREVQIIQLDKYEQLPLAEGCCESRR